VAPARPRHRPRDGIRSVGLSWDTFTSGPVARAGNVQRELHVRLDLAADESLGAGLPLREALLLIVVLAAARCRRAVPLGSALPTLFVLVSERREIAALA